MNRGAGPNRGHGSSQVLIPGTCECHLTWQHAPPMRLYLEMRTTSSVIQLALNDTPASLSERGRGRSDTDRRRGGRAPLKWEADIGVSDAAKSQGVPAAA